MKTYCSLLATAAIALGVAGQVHADLLFHDNFETHKIGDHITDQSPPAGSWGFTALVTASAHTVQANPLGSGQVLRGVREGTGGATGFPTARSDSAPQGKHIVTVTWDWFRVDQGSTANVRPFYLGGSLPGSTTLSVNAHTHELRYHDGSANVGTGVNSGFGGWERFEMVITFGPEDNDGNITGVYDLFFERLDAGNSQGMLARTQVASDVPLDMTFPADEGNMRLFYGINEHAFNSEANPQDAIVYFDNMSISMVIPEPGSLALSGAGLLLLMCRRRRVAC